ncbi:MAG: FG-GAP repeat domain-containing protein, partial [Anaerolineae bacterium]
MTAYADGRGQPNLLVSLAPNYTASVLEFDGNGWDWTQPVQSLVFPGYGTGNRFAYTSAAADLNSDGTSDIIVASLGDRIDWFDSMSPNPENIIATDCDGARDVCVGDFDGDGDLDVAAACQNENRIHWWENANDGGSWTAKTITVNFPGATAVECGDINGDGVDEMVAANSDVVWFKPDATIGDGSTMGWITDAFTGTEFIDLHDLDRDGDLDVLATSPTLDELAWLENTGTGSYFDDFAVHGLDESVGGIREVAAGDLNGDGAPDIVVAAQDTGRVRWYEQIVDTQLSIEKSLDPMQTGVISTGQSISYDIQITNNSLNGATVDVQVVDRWEPLGAVAAASSDEDCIADFSHSVMTCTLSVNAGQIKPMSVVLTPSLLFDGFITNTAQVLPVGPFWNSTSYLDTDAAAPVEVQQDMAIWDGAINLGTVPGMPVLPGQTFTYTVGVVNFGPRPNANAWVAQIWEPIIAIDGFTVVGATMSNLQLSAADYNCYTGEVEDGVMCDFSNLAVGVPLTVTIG